MPTAKARVLLALKTHPADQFVSEFLLDRTPHVFGGSTRAYARWRRDLASALGVDAAELAVVGSAATGVSLNPNKGFKRFDANSDIDVAVISAYHFELAWRWLRRLGAVLYGLPDEVRSAVKSHRSRYVYDGTIATDRLLAYLPFGADWVPILAHFQMAAPCDGRDLNVRLYRDWWALRDYHVKNASSLRENHFAA